jgi:acetyl esterase/lipase
MSGTRERSMSVAPEIRSLLDWGRAVDDRYGSLALPDLRHVLKRESDEWMRRRGTVVETVAGITDLSVLVTGGSISIRVFVPDREGPHPAFLHFHGGGFVFGTVDSLVNNAKCAHICRSAGCVVVTVDYRLAPEFRFPTAPEDCYAALLWTVENAEELYLDPRRIAVGGESAGGNLAAVVALMARDRNGPSLALQVLEVPVTDIGPDSADHPSVALFAEGYGLDCADMQTFADAYLSDPAEGSDPYASPLLANNLAGVAPAHVLTAELDILRDSGEAYARRLQSAGVSTTLHRFAVQTHASSVLWQTWAPARAWMDDVVAALRSALHAAPGSVTSPVTGQQQFAPKTETTSARSSIGSSRRPP